MVYGLYQTKKKRNIYIYISLSVLSVEAADGLGIILGVDYSNFMFII